VISTRTLIGVGAALALLCGGPLHATGDPAPRPAIAPGDPWTASQLVSPVELDALLKTSKSSRPVLLHVGFRALYRQGGIPGSIYAGPGSRPEGIEALRKAVAFLPKTRPIVIYCGCCPWAKCPNVRPAFRTLSQLGFTRVRVLAVAENFTRDWVERGFPVAPPSE
jgi:hypothetical protein